MIQSSNDSTIMPQAIISAQKLTQKIQLSASLKITEMNLIDSSHANFVRVESLTDNSGDNGQSAHIKRS
jgi:hypothetical protein